MMYTVQETDNAYGGDGPPESAWRDVSRHRTLAAAAKKHDALHKAMRRRCGPNSWDSHRRVVDGRGEAIDPAVLERELWR